MAGPASALDDQNCANFATQAEAQAHYRADTSDPDQLDADDDGIACEDNPGYAEKVTDMDPVDTEPAETMAMPKGGVATGGGSTSGIEHGSLLVTGALALTIGALGSILAARRARV